MRLKKFSARLNDYYERLDQQKARPIEPCHVKEVIRKLEAKEFQLQEKLAAAHKQDKRDRMASKLETVSVQISRARHLLREVETSA